MMDKMVDGAGSGQKTTSGEGDAPLRFLKTGAETGGRELVLEATYQPQSAAPPAHYHPYQEERFTVLDGEMKVTRDGVTQTYGAGQTFTVPAGTSHSMYNAGDAAARVRWEVRPALNTEAFLRTTWGLAGTNGARSDGSPHFLQAVVIGQAYRREFRLTQPPYWLQQVLFALLAPLGRLKGYRSRYD
jgi:quercetin dioxygenase-like cupin family protein